MRAIALPDDDSLSVVESSSPGSRKLLRYRVEYVEPDRFSSGYSSDLAWPPPGGGSGAAGGTAEYVHRYPHYSDSPVPSYF